jgi:outer membrane murein-binding lipoprotein Lpp
MLKTILIIIAVICGISLLLGGIYINLKKNKFVKQTGG